ncbi:unnamed protein product [Rhizophagus irregularis]|nr:unnamed protein product [Rhizophagus irregularis]
MDEIRRNFEVISQNIIKFFKYLLRFDGSASRAWLRSNERTVDNSKNSEKKQKEAEKKSIVTKGSMTTNFRSVRSVFEEHNLRPRRNIPDIVIYLFNEVEGRLVRFIKVLLTNSFLDNKKRKRKYVKEIERLSPEIIEKNNHHSNLVNKAILTIIF